MDTKGMFTSNSHEWETPQYLFDGLNDQYHFTLDPCATAENAKCKKFYTKEDDGLSKDWNEERPFVNPPYGREVGKWIKKASEIQEGLVVCLLPARTDTRYFHDYIYDRETGIWKAEVRLLKGRLKFGGGENSAPFPSMIVVFDPEHWDNYCLSMIQKWALGMRRNYGNDSRESV